MSAVEGDRTHANHGTSAPMPPPGSLSGDIDVPGTLVGQIAERYARAERERRNTNVERAIARARGLA